MLTGLFLQQNLNITHRGGCRFGPGPPPAPKGHFSEKPTRQPLTVGKPGSILLHGRKGRAGQEKPTAGNGQSLPGCSLGWASLLCLPFRSIYTRCSEGVVAEELDSLPPSKAGFSRDAVTNVRREQACPPHCCSSSSGIYLGNAVHGLGSKQAQRNVPGSLPGQDVTVPHAAHH